MKPQYKILSICAVAAALIALTTAASNTDNPPKFEYQIIEQNGRNPENVLNEAGAQGWELVTVSDSPRTHYILKRRVK